MTRISLSLFVVSASFVLAGRVLPLQDPEDCDYQWTEATEWACNAPRDCTAECATMTFGSPCGPCSSMSVCICNIIGPNPHCCEMGESTCEPGVYCSGGACGPGACPHSGLCLMIATYNQETGKVVKVEAECESS